jgi:hypothetical protein
MGSFGQLKELGAAELRLNVRSAGLRIVTLVMVSCVAIGLVALRYAPDFSLRPGPLAAEWLRGLLSSLLLMLAPPLVCGAALREKRLGMDELVLSKPPSSRAYVWSRFAGATAAVMLVVPVCAVASMIGQAGLFKGEVAWLATLTAALRSLPPLLFVCALSYALALFAGSAMVAGLVIALPIGMGAGAAYLVPALKFTLTPYHLAYALLGLGIIAAIAGWWERGREPGIGPTARLLPVAACLVAAVAAGGWFAFQWQGLTLDPDARSAELADWTGKKVPLPDIPLKTLDGGTFHLGDWKGKQVVLVFWTDSAPNTAVEAAVMERAWRDTSPERVAFATACITEDPLHAADVARSAGLRGRAIWNPPARFDTHTGLAATFGIEGQQMVAQAALIPAEGDLTRGATLVTMPNMEAKRPPPPRKAWERRLHELAVQAFRTLDEQPDKEETDGA